MLEEIKKEDFNKIVDKFSCKNFFQTKEMGSHLENRGKEVYYLGFKVGGKYEGATIIYSNYSLMGKKAFECLKGVIVDYNNIDFVKMFLSELIKFVKEKNGFKLAIDPYIVVKERDINGDFVDGGIDNYDVINTLKEMGFVKSKVDVQVKFNFVLGIDGKSSDALFKDFSSNTKNRINRALKEGVEIHTLKYDELADFKQITEDAARRRGFKDKSLEYYQEMYKLFKDKVVFKIAKLDVNKHIELLQREITNLEETMNKEEVGRSKKEKCKNEIDGLKKKIDKIKTLAGKRDVIDLAGAMFMLYGDEVIYLFSGGYDEFNSYGGQYLIQWDMIKYAASHGYKRHNFFGIFGFKDKSEENYGIYEFKRGFNGYVEELLGEYDYYLGGIPTLVERLKSLRK